MTKRIINTMLIVMVSLVSSCYVFCGGERKREESNSSKKKLNQNKYFSGKATTQTPAGNKPSQPVNSNGSIQTSTGSSSAGPANDGQNAKSGIFTDMGKIFRAAEVEVKKGVQTLENDVKIPSTLKRTKIKNN